MTGSLMNLLSTAWITFNWKQTKKICRSRFNIPKMRRTMTLSKWSELFFDRAQLYIILYLKHIEMSWYKLSKRWLNYFEIKQINMQTLFYITEVGQSWGVEGFLVILLRPIRSVLSIHAFTQGMMMMIVRMHDLHSSTELVMRLFWD